MRRVTRSISAAVSIGCALTAVIAACGDDDEAVSSSAVDDAGAERASIARDANRLDVEDAGAPFVDPFADWVTFKGYPGCISLRVPPSAARLPPRPTWEDCAVGSPAGCRRMVLDWAPRAQSAPYPPMWLNVTLPRRISSRGGTVTVMTDHWYPDNLRLHLIHDIDGPVHFAVASHDRDCWVREAASDGEVYGYDVLEVDATGDPTDWRGVIAGKLGEREPSYAERVAPPQDWRSYVVSPAGIADSRGGFRFWSDGGLDAGVPMKMPGIPQYARGEFFFAPMNESVSVWSLDGGTNVILTPEDGGTRNYLAETATDGVDLVWLESKYTSVPVTMSDVAMFTSPHATTAAGVQKRLLRDDLGNHGVAGFLDRIAVGCGYAARDGYHDLADGGEEQGLTIVRLSDGAGWFIPAEPAGTSGFRPFAVSCTEIFALAFDGDHGHRTNIARLRIDALGPPTPP